MMITAYYSKGAFSVKELYQMPVYLRQFYIQEFAKLKKDEAERIEKSAKR